MISVLHKKGKPLQEAITPIITVFRQPLAAKQSRLRSLLQICLPPPQACNFKYQHLSLGGCPRHIYHFCPSGSQIRAGLKLPLSLSCTRIEFFFLPHISSGVTGQDPVLLYVYFSLVNFFFHIIFSVLYPEPLLMEIQHLATYSLWWVE